MRGHSCSENGVASLAHNRLKNGVATLAYGRLKNGVATLAYGPGIHVFTSRFIDRTCMAGTGPATTRCDVERSEEAPRFFYPFIVKPPDTLITCPVMKLASSLDRNAIMPGISSGCPSRLSGIARFNPS